MASPAIGASATPITGLGTSQTTAGITTTASGSSFFVMFATGDSSTVTSVTDSKSNTYSLLTSVVDSNDGHKNWVYYTENGTGGSSHTFTVTTSGNNLNIFAFEVTGGATSSIIDVSATVYNDGETPFDCSITTTVAETLAIAYAHAGSGTGSWTANGGFTAGQSAQNAGAAFTDTWAYKAVASAGTENPAWTYSEALSGSKASRISFAIKPAAAAAGQPTMRRWGGVPGMTPGPQSFGRGW